MKYLIMFGALLALVGSVVQPVQADTPKPGYELTLALQAPLLTQSNSFISNWKTTEFQGKLTLTHFFGAISPWVEAVQNFGGPDSLRDNDLKAGVDVDLSRNLRAFSYWERKLGDTKDDRVFVGVKWVGIGTF